MQPVQQQYAQQMQQQHLAASSSSSQGPQHVPGGSGGYPGQSSAYNSTMMHDRANLGGEFAPLEVSGVLQFSNGILGPQAAGAGNWQPPPPQHMSYASPFTPAPNPTPYLRQGVPSSLGNSNARISQRLELPPLPRPLSSAAVVADAQPDTAVEFKPAVYYASDGVMRIAPAAPRTSAARPLDNSRAPQLAQAPPGNIFTSTSTAIPVASSSSPSPSAETANAAVDDRPELVFEDPNPFSKTTSNIWSLVFFIMGFICFPVWMCNISGVRNKDPRRKWLSRASIAMCYVVVVIIVLLLGVAAKKDLPALETCLGKPLDFEVGKFYSKIPPFKSPDQWMFFKVLAKEDMASRVTFNVFVNTTRRQPPFIVLVRELYTSGSVCPHPSKTYMMADSLNFKAEYKVFNPKQVGFPGIGVPTMQVTLVPSAVTARYYVAAIATSAEAVGLPLYFESYPDPL